MLYTLPSPLTIPTGGLATHVVSQLHPAATDNANPKGTYARPRLTIPAAPPPGSIIDLVGDYGVSHTSPNRLTLKGTQAQPIIIRGGQALAGTILRGWELEDSTWFKIERLKFRQAPILLGCQFWELSYNEMDGALGKGGLAVADYGDGKVNAYGSILRNYVHHQGDVAADFDEDAHGIVIGKNVHDVTIAWNTLAFNSGDGLQINAGQHNQATTHHIWVYGNSSAFNKQTGYWCKQASDVIFAQNRSWGHKPSNSSLGQGMGAQYGPEYVWWLENEIWDCQYGIQIGSDLGAAEDGKRAFLVGNKIRDIHPNGVQDENSWQSAAISLQGIAAPDAIRIVLTNTITNAPCGIAAGVGNTGVRDNVYSGVAKNYGTLSTAGAAALATVEGIYHGRYGL